MSGSSQVPWQGGAAADTPVSAAQVQYGNGSDANANATDDRLRVALTLRYPPATLAQPEQAAMRTIYKQCALHEPFRCTHEHVAPRLRYWFCHVWERQNMWMISLSASLGRPNSPRLTVAMPSVVCWCEIELLTAEIEAED